MNFTKKIFLKKLTEQLPKWQENGWVSGENGAAILDHAAKKDKEQASSIGFLSYLGAIVLGIGVIVFFAANWNEIPKLSKLIILFSSMWGAYGFGGWLLIRGKYPLIGQALILLGTILFGSNIMLIAQIYHIDSHYPDGVLVWSLGALLVAYLMRIPIIAIFGLCLAVLWSGMESFSFLKTPHWSFCILWAAYLGLCLKEGWHKTQHMAGIALGIWLLMFIPASISDGPFKQYFTPYYLTLLILLPGIAAALTYAKAAESTAIIRHYLILIFLGTFYWIGFDFILNGGNYSANLFAKSKLILPEYPIAINAIYIFSALFTGLCVYFFLNRTYGNRLWDKIMTTALFAALFILGIITLQKIFEPSTLSALYRITFFLALVWLAHYGYETARKSYINIAIFFIIILLMTVYFTTLWTLMNRSFVLMGGGVLLLGLSFFLNWQRQKYIGKIKQGGENS